MKATFEHLRKVSNTVNFESFYSIRFKCNKIQLQGNYTPSLVLSLQDTFKCFFETDSNGNLTSEFWFDGVEFSITLT